MKPVKTLVVALAAATASGAFAEVRYAGGDISLLPEYENAGATYKTHTGQPIADLLPWLRSEGMNAMRVRLFVNPQDYNGVDKDPNACQDLDYIIPLCRRIKDAGFDLLLDFHYSDTWADPVAQWTPGAWSNLSSEQLKIKIYEYTKESLLKLKENGVTPDFIQPGNEISFGMLWGPYGTPQSDLDKVNISYNDDWGRLCDLLKQAVKGCKEICPDAKIVLHTERVADTSALTNFYNHMRDAEVDYDIIGLSYYPYFHGKLSKLGYALSSLERLYPDKKIMIVETGYSYKWEVPGTSESVDYPYTDAGQNQFAEELVELLLRHESVDGLFWWWMEYNAFNTSLSGWYNAPLFNSETGRATAALKAICAFGEDAGVEGVPDDAENPEGRWYNLQGIPVEKPAEPGLYISPERRVVKF